MPPERKQIPVLTGLRGVAAYSVLIDHSIDTSIINMTAEAANNVVGLAYFGMSLFFVLSGFVIHYNYAQMFVRKGLRIALREFLIARFARLYPLYFVLLILSLSWGVLAPAMTDPWMAFVSFTLTQSWLNFPAAVGGVAGNAWSVSTEFGFYVFFVLIVFPIERIRRPPVVVLTVFSTLTLAALALIFSHTAGVYWVLDQLPNIKGTGSTPWLWLTYFSPYFRVPEFICGIFASKAYLALSVKPRYKWYVVRPFLWASLTWCGVVIILAPHSSNWLIAPLLTNFIFAPAITALIIIVTLYPTRIGRWLSSPTLVAAGEISYSVYLWQALIIVSMAGAFTGENPTGFVETVLRTAAMIGAATVVGYGSYALIEVPARRSIRQAFAGRSTAPGPIKSPLGA
jgi:peptidoglycan/LPS O-acetylase OafA/YrhL